MLIQSVGRSNFGHLLNGETTKKSYTIPKTIPHCGTHYHNKLIIHLANSIPTTLQHDRFIAINIEHPFSAMDLNDSITKTDIVHMGNCAPDNLNSTLFLSENCGEGIMLFKFFNLVFKNIQDHGSLLSRNNGWTASFESL